MMRFTTESTEERDGELNRETREKTRKGKDIECSARDSYQAE